MPKVPPFSHLLGMSRNGIVRIYNGPIEKGFAFLIETTTRDEALALQVYSCRFDREIDPTLGTREYRWNKAYELTQADDDTALSMMGELREQLRVRLGGNREREQQRKLQQRSTVEGKVSSRFGDA